MGDLESQRFLLALRLELPVQLRVTGVCALNIEHPGVLV